MREPTVLLAKRPRDPNAVRPRETLIGHSQDVGRAFTALFGEVGAPTRLAERFLAFLRVAERDVPAFFATGQVAAYVHDVGKSNSAFQAAVAGRDSGHLQAIRHEHLSGLLLYESAIREWLRCLPGVDYEVLLSSVLGHHLRASYENFGEMRNPDMPVVQVHADGALGVLRLIPQAANTLPHEIAVPHLWSFEALPGGVLIPDAAQVVKRHLHRYRRALVCDENRQRLLWAVRSALVLSDSSGSGLPREGHDVASWIAQAFDAADLIEGGMVDDFVIEPRIADIRRKRGAFRWNDFQDAAATMPARALLLAPCGSGKTLAAWRWIKAQADRQPIARVLFLYPTRATATEGFRDYVAWAPEADAALVHGTSAYDLQGLFENGDERAGHDYATEERLFALGCWTKRVFSATVDQFLGFMQHAYGSTCLLPLLADSVVVIDEVHSFDRPLFSALRRFLTTFDVPVLCMTASLPARRRRDLEACGLVTFPDDSRPLDDLEAKANRERYRVQCLTGPGEAEDVARQALAEGKRVLWVVNTVDRCQKLASRLEALCYHSRFRLMDRKTAHAATVAAFQQDARAVLAITTQVCEMSLDLDAQVLITESAPVTSLIQRMGRCNRHAASGGEVGGVFIYPAENDRPYDAKELAGRDEFIGRLNGHTLSQTDLQDLLEELGPTEVEVGRYAAFLESGPWAQSREASLREEDDYLVSAVLDTDVAEYLRLKADRKPTDGLIVPVPRRCATPDTRLGAWLSVAPSDHYDPHLGFWK